MFIKLIFICQCNHFDGEIFIMLDSSVTDHWFKPQLDHTKDNKNGTDQYYLSSMI
jgi:hypothetical protein